MQHPGSEISTIVNLMCCAVNPEVQKQTILKYFTPNASFRHPICCVPSAPDSVHSILGIYQWYRILSPSIRLSVNRIVYDKVQGQIFLEVSQEFHIRFSPFRPAASRLITHLSLVQKDDLYYISSQEDFYHPEDFLSLLVPPLVPVVYLLLRTGTIFSNFNASALQLLLGLWRPASNLGRSTTTDGSSDGGSSKED